MMWGCEVCFVATSIFSPVILILRVFSSLSPPPSHHSCPHWSLLWPQLRMKKAMNHTALVGLRVKGGSPVTLIILNDYMSAHLLHFHFQPLLPVILSALSGNGGWWGLLVNTNSQWQWVPRRACILSTVLAWWVMRDRERGGGVWSCDTKSKAQSWLWFWYCDSS